jgi:hypothetical protein
MSRSSQLLVGEWASTRHGNPYTLRANGKWGRTASSLDDNWRIKGNQYFARDATGKIDGSGTIIPCKVQPAGKTESRKKK